MKGLVQEKDEGALDQRDVCFQQPIVLGGALAQRVDIFVPN